MTVYLHQDILEVFYYATLQKSSSSRLRTKSCRMVSTGLRLRQQWSQERLGEMKCDDKLGAEPNSQRTQEFPESAELLVLLCEDKDKCEEEGFETCHSLQHSTRGRFASVLMHQEVCNFAADGPVES